MKKLILSFVLVPFMAAFASYDGWSEPIMIADGEYFVNEYDNPFLALDLDENYIVVHRRWNGQSDVYFTKIDQAGNVLVEPTPIAATTNEEYAPVCVVTSDNLVYLFYIRRDSGYRNVYYMKLNTYGQILEDAQLFVQTNCDSPGTRVLPAIVKEPDDTIHLTYKVEINDHNFLGYTRWNPYTEERLDISGFEVEHPKVYGQFLDDTWDVDVDSEGNAHLFFDQTLVFNWMNPITEEVCWARVSDDSEGEYVSKIISNFYDDGLRDDRGIRGEIDDNDILHLMWAGILDGPSEWIYYSMDKDGNEVTGYKKAFPPPWDTEFFNATTAYNNGNIAVVGVSSDRLVFGRTDLEGEIYEDIDYISDEVIHEPRLDEFNFIHHNNSFVCIVWPDGNDLWYMYTLDGVAADEPDLEAYPDKDGILLSWREEGELIGSTWRLERDGERLVNLSGDALYRYLDRDAEPNITHLYTLEATLHDGPIRRFGPVEAAWPGPDADRFTLYAAFPCPATDRVTLSFYLPEGTKNVELSLYDLSGRLMESSVNVPTDPGRHEIAYDTSDLPPGVYLARLATDAGTLTRRVVITR